MLTLIRSRRFYGFGGKSDYAVLNNGRKIGRIFLSPASPPDRNWMWTITAREYPPTIYSHGYSATREEAMADFKKQWLTHRNEGERLLQTSYASH